MQVKNKIYRKKEGITRVSRRDGRGRSHPIIAIFGFELHLTNNIYTHTHIHIYNLCAVFIYNYILWEYRRNIQVWMCVHKWFIFFTSSTFPSFSKYLVPACPPWWLVAQLCLKTSSHSLLRNGSHSQNSSVYVCESERDGDVCTSASPL